jgi:hypothetical protein
LWQTLGFAFLVLNLKIRSADDKIKSNTIDRVLILILLHGY